MTYRQQKIAEHERAAAKIKSTINQALELEGRPPLYDDLDSQGSRRRLTPFAATRSSVGRLHRASKQILEARQTMNRGAASQEELYAALIAGGFDFEAKSEDQAKRNLAISLGKNMMFMRTPHGHWGLRNWYGPSKKRSKGADAEVASEEVDAETEAAAGDDDAEDLLK